MPLPRRLLLAAGPPLPCLCCGRTECVEPSASIRRMTGRDAARARAGRQGGEAGDQAGPDRQEGGGLWRLVLGGCRGGRADQLLRRVRSGPRPRAPPPHERARRCRASCPALSWLACPAPSPCRGDTSYPWPQEVCVAALTDVATLHACLAWLCNQSSPPADHAQTLILPSSSNVAAYQRTVKLHQHACFSRVLMPGPPSAGAYPARARRQAATSCARPPSASGRRLRRSSTARSRRWACRTSTSRCS